MELAGRDALGVVMGKLQLFVESSGVPTGFQELIGGASGKTVGLSGGYVYKRCLASVVDSIAQVFQKGHAFTPSFVAFVKSGSNAAYASEFLEGYVSMGNLQCMYNPTKNYNQANYQYVLTTDRITERSALNGLRCMAHFVLHNLTRRLASR